MALFAQAFIEVWSEELAQAGRIALENFRVQEVKRIDLDEQAGTLLVGGKLRRAPCDIKKLTVRPRKRLRMRLRNR